MALHSKDMHKNKITIESISTDDIRSVCWCVFFFCIFIIIVQYSFRLWMLKAKPFTMFARNDFKPNKDEWMGTMDGLSVYFGALQHRARSFFGNCSAQQRGTRCMEQQRLNEWVLRPWPSRGSLQMALLMPFTYVHQLNFMTHYERNTLTYVNIYISAFSFSFSRRLCMRGDSYVLAHKMPDTGYQP